MGQLMKGREQTAWECCSEEWARAVRFKLKRSHISFQKQTILFFPRLLLSTRCDMHLTNFCIPLELPYDLCFEQLES